MNANNKKKAEQLGMPYGTANSRLRKQILFRYVQKCKDDTCFHCGRKIEDIDNFSIEHKVPWLDNNIELFWDLDNIAFSHLKCNTSAARRTTKGQRIHGTPSSYNKGCRCDLCRETAVNRVNEYRWKNGRKKREK